MSAAEAKDVENKEPSYVVPKMQTLDQIMSNVSKDADMRKYTAALINPSAKPYDAKNPSKVILVSLSLTAEGREPITTSLADLSKTTFTLKEGAVFRLGVTFYVQHDITSCLRLTHSVTRMKVPITKEAHTLGAYPPKTEAYTFLLEPQTAPEGVMGRGEYHGEGKLADDDNVYATFSYTFKVKEGWA